MTWVYAHCLYQEPRNFTEWGECGWKNEESTSFYWLFAHSRQQFMAALSDVYMTDLTDFLNFLAMSETFRVMEEMAEILNLLNAG